MKHAEDVDHLAGCERCRQRFAGKALAADSGEAGLANWVVYLDQNNNDTLDAGEASTTTDAAGSYAFPNATPGTSKRSSRVSRLSRCGPEPCRSRESIEWPVRCVK